MRRDLTINALYYNLNEKKVEDFTGKDRGFENRVVPDAVGGKEDFRGRSVRF